MTGTYRYVLHGLVDAYLAGGWIFETSLGPWSSLMRACACNPDGEAPSIERGETVK